MRMKPVLASLLAVAAISAPMLAEAQVYVCQTAKGTLYTNKRSRGCQAQQIQKVGSFTSKDPAPVSRPAPVVASQSGARIQGAPNQIVAQDVQRKRDETRLSILENELKNEERALDQAQRNLVAGKELQPGETPATRDERVKRMEGAVLDRQENIKALRAEISRF